MDTYETTIYTAVLITGVLLGIIILFFVWAFVRSQKLYHERRKKLFVQEIDIHEEERKRIAHDLHDELGPELAITRLQIQRVAMKAEGLSKELLNEAESTIDNILKRMGAIARDLTPRNKLQKGLQAMLQDYIDQWQTVYNVSFIYEFQVNSNLNNDLSLQVFRIVQEIVFNSIKHAEASVITIQLKEYKRRLYLFVKDNGNGFDLLAAKNKGIGLNSIWERTILLGGNMQCKTSQHSGTNYFFTLPLKRK